MKVKTLIGRWNRTASDMSSILPWWHLAKNRRNGSGFIKLQSKILSIDNEKKSILNHCLMLLKHWLSSSHFHIEKFTKKGPVHYVLLKIFLQVQPLYPIRFPIPYLGPHQMLIQCFFACMIDQIELRILHWSSSSWVLALEW